MNLSTFIRKNEFNIIEGWERFAQSYIPAAKNMNSEGLSDHIVDILRFIADDLDSEQTSSQQSKKSKGQGARTNSDDSAAEFHADMRFVGGFDAVELISEFRALRASVTRLWGEQRTHTEQDYADMVRFNEAIDQVIAEGISRYTERINHARDLFLGTLIHDMRNPLGAASQSAQLLGMVGELNKKQGILVDQISTSLSRVTQMVANLIDVVRARLGKGVPLSPAFVDMGKTIQQAVNEARAAHPEQAIQVKCMGDLTGEWDNQRIEQILSNLIGNAIQHGAKTATISVIATGNKQDINISVHNEGVPISESVVSTIFDPLTRGGNSPNENNPTNLGLGLFIVKEIVEAHGGKIHVSSSEGEGTTFSVDLPRAA